MPEPDQVLIKSTWPFIPKKVDAAYENPEKDLVIMFSGGLCVVLIYCIYTIDLRYSVYELHSFSITRDKNVGFEWV